MTGASSSAASGDSPATVFDGPSEPVPAGSATDVGDLVVGDRVGRYVLLEIVGQGAMGRVLRAYDPKLQREVALKVVHTHVAGPDARDRLLREARAMAKLSHANVVAVFDAEDSAVGVVLVMELVDGRTLRKWIQQGPHRWDEVVGRFVEAGRGLAAAHRQDILHRDFKPANVLVADSGEVKVTDFGLAKLASASAQGWSQSLDPDSSDGVLLAPGESVASGSRDSLGGSLTRADTIVGTPRYMAPEQHRREPLGPAVDQYAFCVALWEALTGKPPFTIKTLQGLAAHKTKGPPPWPTDVSVPRPIVDAIRRGLAPEAAERWPSMDALLEALRFDPSRRRRRWLTAASVVGVVGVMGAGWQQWAAASAQRCTGAEDQLAGIWDDERRPEVETALRSVGASYAGRVAERATEEIDAYTSAWIEMHTDACEATTVRGEQSAAALDLRMECLDRARMELRATVDVLADADADVVQRAHQLVDGLRPLSRCADIAALTADVEPPLAADANAVDQIRTRLAEARAEGKAGRHPRARELTDQAEEALAGVGYEPIRTEVLLEKGIVLGRVGEYEDAVTTLQEALRLAARLDQRQALRRASLQLMYVVGSRLKRTDEAMHYRSLAQGLSEGDPDYESFFHNNLALILAAQGDYAEAEAEHRHTLALREQVHGPDHPIVAESRNNLGIVLNTQGKYDEAEAEHRRTLALRERVLAPDHPDTASSWANLGNVLLKLGRVDESEAAYRRALEIQEAALGSHHPDTISLRGNIGTVLFERNDYAAAEAEFRRAAELQQEQLGPDHPNVGASRINLAVALKAQDRLDEAETELRTVIASWERALGADHPNVATARNNLANLLHLRGELDEAEALHRQAGAVWSEALDAEHPQLAVSRCNLARVLLDAGRPEDALPLAEQAWTRLQRDDTSPGQQAEAAFALARARGETSAGSERVGAIELARRAHATYAGLDESYRGNAETVARWLREHGASVD